MRGRGGSSSGSSCESRPVSLSLFCSSPSVLFAALRVELEQQAEGGEAEQKGLAEPHAASGHAVDALVPVRGGKQRARLSHDVAKTQSRITFTTQRNLEFLF